MPFLMLTMCTEKYQEKIASLERERDSIKTEYAKIAIDIAVNEQRVRETENRLREADSIIAVVSKQYNEKILLLSKKTPKEIHEEFNRVYPTTEEPLLVVAHDQVLAALTTNIEKQRCEDEKNIIEGKVESLNKMLSIKDVIISDKDKQIELLKREVETVSASYEFKVRACEDTIKKERRKDMIQKGVIIVIAATLLLL